MSLNLKRSFRRLKNRKKRKSKKKFGSSHNFLKTLYRGVVFLIVFFIVFLGYRYVNVQVENLKKLTFLNNQKYSFKENADIPEFSKESPFSLLLVIGDGEDKKLINHVVLLYVDPVADSGFSIAFPKDLWLSAYTPSGYDYYSYDQDFVKIKDMLLVGDLMNPPRPIAYSILEIEELLALDVDGYVYFTKDVYPKIANLGNGESILADESIGSFSEQSTKLTSEWFDFINSVSIFKVWANREVISDISSNMNPSDLYSFIDTFSHIDAENFNLIEYSEMLLIEEVDAKGDVVYVMTQNVIDEALEGVSRDERIEKEQARVEIFNGSGINGLGNRYGRWIRHLGADVIRVENASGDWPNSVIYVTDEDKYEYSLSRIKSIWDDDIEVRVGRPDFVSTGDVIVVLGLDI